MLQQLYEILPRILPQTGNFELRRYRKIQGENMSSSLGAGGGSADDTIQSSLEQLQFQLEQLKNNRYGQNNWRRILRKSLGGVCPWNILCCEGNPSDNASPKEFEFRKRSFLVECECASRMRHPNLVQVLGIYYPTPQAKLPCMAYNGVTGH